MYIKTANNIDKINLFKHSVPKSKSNNTGNQKKKKQEP